MADVKWIKLATDIFDNRKIKQIEKMPEGDSVIVIWVKLLCLAGNINDNGLVYLTEEIPYTDEMLATEFNKPLPTIRLALGLFQKFGMLEVIDDIYHVSSWEKYQNVSGLEKLREQNRIRVNRYREKQKALACNVTCNVTDTLSNGEVMHIDKDKEKDKEIEKEKKTDKLSQVISESGFVFDDSVIETIKEFIKMRKQIKAPMTDRALQLLLGKLVSYSKDPGEQIAILNESIENSWKGIYPPKGKPKSKTAPSEEHNYDMEALRRRAKE